jgi:periplasmic protein TonB
MLAVAIAFLGAGLAGIARPVVDVPADWLSVSPPPPAVIAVEDITMADLPDEPAVEEVPNELPPDSSPPPDDTESPPEPEPVLTEKDIMPVPGAPRIEPALRPIDPVPREKQKDPPRSANPPASMPRPDATAPAGNGSGGVGGGGGAGVKGGRGKFPKPPYPSFARSRGLTGTVTLSIKVDPSGDVSGVSVAGSTGSSQLDEYAASWVSRRWKWPAGAARVFRMPVTFRLR